MIVSHARPPAGALHPAYISPDETSCEKVAAMRAYLERSVQCDGRLVVSATGSTTTAATAATATRVSRAATASTTSATRVCRATTAGDASTTATRAPSSATRCASAAAGIAPTVRATSTLPVGHD